MRDMASIYSKVKKRDFITPTQEPGYLSMVKALLLACAPPDCILVNVQSVADDMDRGEDSDNVLSLPEVSAIQAVRPPFLAMWMECVLWGDLPIALQVLRNEERETIRNADGECVSERQIFVLPWSLANGPALSPLVRIEIYLSGEDTPLMIQTQPFVEFSDGDRSAMHGLVKAASICVLHSIARMNCRNTELRPISQPKRLARAPHDPVPASVWHEIKITSVPKLRAATSGQGSAPEHRRAYWMRGHYADYRKGSGLFGNPKLKAIFWIPEHRRGDESLGQVIPEYHIQ
jgi:hypothetical protein